MRKDLILVGRFGAPHGVRGEIRLQSFTDEPRAIAGYRPLLDATAERRFVIEALRPVKDDLFVAKLFGIETRSDAEALTNLELFVPRASLPDLESEEFYLADLIGLEAVTADGAPFGRIIAVPDYGGGPLLEIAPTEGGDSLLLPFTRAIVPVVDLVAARIVVVPPAEVSGEETPPTDPNPKSGSRRRT
jgi:16S rRNA processing protein RimM